MHILLNLLSAGSGGALNYARNMTPLLAARLRETPQGKLTVLAYPGLLSGSRGTVDSAFEVRELPRVGGFKRALWEQLHFPRMLRDFKPDVVFSPYQIGPTPSGIRSILMLRNMEPFLYQHYRSPVRKNLRNFLLRELGKKSLKRATHIVAVSQYVNEHAICSLGVSPTKLSMIYHGRDIAFAPVAASCDSSVLAQVKLSNHEFILTCGSLLPYRRCEDIVHAYIERLSIDFPAMHLVIAGAPLDPGYVNTTCSVPENLRKRVHFLGHVSTDTLAALYRACAVFVTATEVEACPNIAIEAMASGCRIVSANTPPLQELFRASATYYQQRNRQEMANAIAAILKERRAYCEQSALALKLAEEFSWQKCADQTFEVLLRVATSPAYGKFKTQ